jgi:hypothetical protein
MPILAAQAARLEPCARRSNLGNQAFSDALERAADVGTRISIGAGALGGAAYAGWKMYGRPEPAAVYSPLSQAAQSPADKASPAARAGEPDRAQISGETEEEEEDIP